MNNIWGDIPSWIMAIATPVSIIVGFLIARQQLKQSKKIEEQKFILEVDKLFMTTENRSIYSYIYKELYESQPFPVSDDLEANLANYLSDLEYLCNLYEEGIISKKQIESLEGLQISETIKCESVRNFIKQERAKTGELNLWTTIEDVAKEFDTS